MRIVKWIVGAIAILFVVLIVAAFVLPRHATMSRSIEIAAPPAAIFPIVGDLRRFNEWSPWFGLDPKAAYTFTGPIDGVGQTLNWKSDAPNVGNGAMSIVRLEPDKAVDLTIDFGDQGTALAKVQLEPNGAGTKVTWGFESDLGFNPIARYFGLMIDGMVGPDYEKGLANLKALAEKPAAESNSSPLRLSRRLKAAS